ncbi:hypothetical protein EJD97_001563 [Solanum chilense]|uniref:Uncharacterized protein n=1 Tax=Solanum chilense TaxID=4083 RepID=A0A6N2BXM1_SOLCI|nr:hypothetical protein EJD97_001563 [Solanum chilense]
MSPKSVNDYESSYPSNLNIGYVFLLSSGMGTLVGMLEGSRQVGLILALLPWHWLIQDILAKAPYFLSDFYRPLFLK